MTEFVKSPQTESAETEPKGKWESSGFESSRDGLFHIPDENWSFEEVYNLDMEDKRAEWWEEPGLLNAYAVYELNEEGDLEKVCYAATGTKGNGGVGTVIEDINSEKIQKLIAHKEVVRYDRENKLKIAGSFFVDALLWDLEDINEAEGEYKYQLFKNTELNSLAIIRTKKE